MTKDADISEEWAQTMAEQAAATASPANGVSHDDEKKAGTGEPESHADVNLEVILDIPVTVSLEVGRTKMNIRNLLQLNRGSVVEMDRLAGQPMDVLVNGTLLAHGEVVVINERFGIRLTDVISPVERIQRLK
ncbi:MAG: flagellar motor switch protein FliN [Thermodesulfobacteriota bacterium]|nr:flagellar motor switch protein FliN [Thermodesulfobacteriota bacterium]